MANKEKRKKIAESVQNQQKIENKCGNCKHCRFTNTCVFKFINEE